MILIKNARVYNPADLGTKDVLICGEKIEKIDNSEMNGIDFLNQRYRLHMCAYFSMLYNAFHFSRIGFSNYHKIDKIYRFDEQLCGPPLFVEYLP